VKNQQDYFYGLNASDNSNANGVTGISGAINGPLTQPSMPITGSGMVTVGATSITNPTWITTTNTTLPYYSDLTGALTTAGVMWPGMAGQLYEGKPSWLEKSIDKKYIKILVEAKNYNILCNIADIVIRSHRSSFHLLEKSILRSNDFEVIGLYMKSVKNIGVKHLTKNFLQAYNSSTEERKSERFTNMAYESRSKLDLKTCFKFAIKKKDPIYVQWLMSSPYYHEFDTDMIDSKISNKNIDALVSMCGDTNLLFTLANISKMVNKEKIYRKIRNLGDFDLARKMVDSSDEDWAKKLVHMK